MILLSEAGWVLSELLFSASNNTAVLDDTFKKETCPSSENFDKYAFKEYWDGVREKGRDDQEKEYPCGDEDIVGVGVGDCDTLDF